MAFRYRLLGGFFLGCYFLIVARLFYWQVINRQALVQLAARQYNTSREIPAERGKIMAKDGYPLVTDQKNYLLYLNVASLDMPWERLLAQLDQSLGRSIVLQAPENDYLWFPLLRDLNEEEKTKVERLAIPALGFEEGSRRYYPEASMSAQLLGFVGKDQGGGDKGYFGLEGYYNVELQGRAGRRYYERDALGQPIPLGDGLLEEAVAGRSLVTHIDRALQFTLEEHLKQGVRKYGADSGLGVIVDPNSGAVIAMAAFPSYDPSGYAAFDPELYRNPVVSSSFEPGSIYKVLVAAAALEAQAISPEDTCPSCAGPRVIGEYTIETWDDRYYPNSSVVDILVHSDNVGMVYLAEKLGLSRFYRYFQKLGFTEPTGIDLQGEISPPVRPAEDWRLIDLATASFGQGIAVSPLQMVIAVSSIAAKGEMYQPQVVHKIIDRNREIVLPPVKKGRVFSARTSRLVTEIMVAAVERGEAKWAKPEGYRIAGKTGTAQIPIAGHYDADKTIASFIGFAPADNPRFVMLISLREPKSSPWGSETAAPLWFTVAKDIFRIWQISPQP